MATFKKYQGTLCPRCFFFFFFGGGGGGGNVHLYKNKQGMGRSVVAVFLSHTPLWRGTPTPPPPPPKKKKKKK